MLKTHAAACAVVLMAASATAWAQQPDQRAIALAQSLADQAASQQQPKAATGNAGAAAKAAVASATTPAGGR